MDTGKVWLVGAGPSDYGLFTIKGKTVLENADVVIYDHLIGDEIRALIPENAEKVDVGKVAGHHKVVQERINELILEYALQGKKVVRLKGGDPFLFGRGGEELALLKKNKVPFEIVPGVTSAISVPAYAGIPVTHRDYSSAVYIATAHKKEDNAECLDFNHIATLKNTTLVFLMGVEKVEEICQGLIKAGLDDSTPAAIIEKGTTHEQRRVVATLSTLPEMSRKNEIGTPGIIVVGEVCGLAKEFHWAEDRPLGRSRIIVLRPKEKGSAFVDKLRMLGAEIVELPSIRTISVPVDKQGILQKESWKEYSWAVFLSEASVVALFDYLKESKQDIRSLAHIKIATVGMSTKRALEDRGILVDYVPKQYNARQLGSDLAEQMGAEDKVLVFAPEELESPCTQVLQAAGVACEVARLYYTEYVEQPEINITDRDVVAFTSAETVKRFVHTQKNLDFTKVRAACIGNITAEEAMKYGMMVTVATVASIDALIETIVNMECDKNGND